MTRLICLSLMVALAAYFPIQAQQNAPPKYVTNYIGMKFVWIPPGSFVMGAPKDKKDRDGNEFLRKITLSNVPELVEIQQHKVTLTKGFYMGVYTVTQEQWQAVMGNNPSHFKGEKNLPVENVSWKDCQLFIKKLWQQDKKVYGLPTEAEWEYACRAGTTTPFNVGETISTDQANYDGNYTYGNGKKGVYRKKTTPVGAFPPNAFGLYDMHGNVWQWCHDWYGVYPENAVVDPQGPAKGKSHVLRGGSWYDNPAYCRSACRNRNVPTRHNNDIGFRLCFSVE